MCRQQKVVMTDYKLDKCLCAIYKRTGFLSFSTVRMSGKDTTCFLCHCLHLRLTRKQRHIMTKRLQICSNVCRVTGFDNINNNNSVILVHTFILDNIWVQLIMKPFGLNSFGNSVTESSHFQSNWRNKSCDLMSCDFISCDLVPCDNFYK